MLRCALPALPAPLELLVTASRPAVAKGLRIWLDDCARSRASKPLAWSHLYGNVWTYKASKAALRVILQSFTGQDVPLATLAFSIGRAVERELKALRRDNQDENPATIRMRMRRRGGDEGRA
jgi:hypothetical protein